MSSIRKMTPPRRERMESQASRYVRALPMCWAPVGDGARRPVGIRSLVIDALVSCESAGAQRQGRPRVYDIRLANKNKTDNTCLNKYLRCVRETTIMTQQTAVAETDVVVIGGGPAGATVSTLIAQK